MVTRQMMLTARNEYEARYDGTRIERDIRCVACSFIELSSALDAIEVPHRTIAEAAGIDPSAPQAWRRLGVVVLLYPYARHVVDDYFNFGRYVAQYASHLRESFEVVRTNEAPERASFVRTLRTILIRARRHYTPVDWSVLGADILRWDPVAKSEWHHRSAGREASRSVTGVVRQAEERAYRRAHRAQPSANGSS